MSDERVSAVVIIEVNPGKLNRTLELLRASAEYSRTSEPFTLQYEVTQGRVVNPAAAGDYSAVAAAAAREDEMNHLVMHERFESMASFLKHSENEHVQRMNQAAVEEGLAKSIKVIFTDAKGKVGFASRL
ncbi:hypothetical protein F4778DRAFT_782118 [Xylariomycetidae sp. FL2044]|nr:hypothetical protein F4778DRAFT_782118 [Xylariomycetidae sp. FL2044]